MAQAFNIYYLVSVNIAITDCIPLEIDTCLSHSNDLKTLRTFFRCTSPRILYNSVTKLAWSNFIYCKDTKFPWNKTSCAFYSITCICLICNVNRVPSGIVCSLPFQYVVTPSCSYFTRFKDLNALKFKLINTLQVSKLIQNSILTLLSQN